MRPRGAARSARRPVKAETAGSNPAGAARWSWEKRIERAVKKGGRFSTFDHRSAGNWKTCAAGELFGMKGHPCYCDFVAHLPSTVKSDIIVLGFEFADQVAEDRVKQAAGTYNALVEIRKNHPPIRGKTK